MRTDRDIAGGLADRARFTLKFVGCFIVAFVILALIADASFDNASRTDDTIAGFVVWSFLMGAVLGAVISLGNLFFGNPANRVSERLLNPASIAGVCLGGLTGFAPVYLFGGSPSGGPTLGVFAVIGLVVASPITLTFGAIIAFKSNYPRLGDFVMAGTIGVIAAVASLMY